MSDPGESPDNQAEINRRFREIIRQEFPGPIRKLGRRALESYRQLSRREKVVYTLMPLEIGALTTAFVVGMTTPDIPKPHYDISTVCLPSGSEVYTEPSESSEALFRVGETVKAANNNGFCIQIGNQINFTTKKTPDGTDKVWQILPAASVAAAISDPNIAERIREDPDGKVATSDGTLYNHT